MATAGRIKRNIKRQTAPDNGAETDEMGESSANSEDQSLPKPASFTLSPLDFFSYWLSIPESSRNRVVVYPYRLIPVCDALQPLTDEEIENIRRKKREKPQTNLGKLIDPLITQEDLDQWARCLAEKWGAGDYHFKLNDVHPSVKKTVCMCSTNAETPLRDWDAYPPVLNIDEVVLSEQKNQPYIRWARLHGIRFPGDPATPFDSEPNEDDMANIKLAEQIAEQNKELTQKLIERRDNEPSRAPAAPVNGSVELMAEAGKQSLEMLGTAYKALAQQQIKSEDKSTYVEDLMKIADRLRPQGDGGMASMMTQMIQSSESRAQREAESERQRAKDLLEAERARSAQMLEMERKHNDQMLTMMRDELRSVREEITRVRAEPKPAANPPQAGMSLMEKAFSEWMKEKLGGADDEAPALTGWQGVVAETVPKAIDWLGRIGDGWMKSQAANQSAAARNQQPGVTAPSGQIAPPPPKQPTEEEMMFANAFAVLREPILDLMSKGAPGYQLGGLMIATPQIDLGFMKVSGEQAYSFLANMGQSSIANNLQRYDPALHVEMQKYGPARVSQFISELVDQEKSRAAAEEIKAHTQRPAPPQKRTVDATPINEAPTGGGRRVTDPRTGKVVEVGPPTVVPPQQKPVA